MDNKFDVCIVGCGAGGFGAARACLDAGLKVAIVDKNPGPGGMNVYGYVSQWPTGPAESIAESLFNDMQKDSPNEVAIGQQYPASNGAGLWFDAESKAEWCATLNRVENGKPINKNDLRMVIYNADALEKAMLNQLKSYKEKASLFFNTSLVNVQTNAENNKIEKAYCINNDTDELIEIDATVFIDGTSLLALSKQAGCEVLVGDQDASSKVSLNAISLCYKLVKAGQSKIESENACKEFIKPASQFSAYVTGLKGGNIYVTPLQYSVLDGNSVLSLTDEELKNLGQNIADCSWQWLSKILGKYTDPNLDLKGYSFDSYASMLYIRESFRLDSLRNVTSKDILTPLAKKPFEDIIALGQHPFDFHPGPTGNDTSGSFTETSSVNHTYGIPFRSMIPENMDNLLVACTGSGFTHTAASSARLQRLLMGMGHAAGFAAYLFITKSLNTFSDIYVKKSILEELIKEMQTAYKMDSNWANGVINQ